MRDANTIHRDQTKTESRDRGASLNSGLCSRPTPARDDRELDWPLRSGQGSLTCSNYRSVSVATGTDHQFSFARRSSSLGLSARRVPWLSLQAASGIRHNLRCAFTSRSRSIQTSLHQFARQSRVRQVSHLRTPFSSFGCYVLRHSDGAITRVQEPFAFGANEHE